MCLNKQKFALALLMGACLLVGGRLSADDKTKFETDNKNTLVKETQGQDRGDGQFLVPGFRDG